MSCQFFFRSFALLCLAVQLGGLDNSTFAETNSPIQPAAGHRVTELSQPPELPVSKPPVDLFRELLALPPAERDAALTNRPPKTKQRILAKVQEYETMKPDERELRLRATELRWHLLTLMRVASTNRAVQIATVPEPVRKLVEARLAEWDKLSPEAQQAFLTGETSMPRILQVQRRALILPDPNKPKPSPEQLQKFETDLARWRSLPNDQKKLIAEHFNNFFELTGDEKSKILGTLSESERAQMQKTLQTFAGLPKSQRDQCLSAFSKLAGMTPEEQRQFLQNAERWQAMPPADRQAWRDLVSKLPLALSSPPKPSRRLFLPSRSTGSATSVVSTN